MRYRVWEWRKGWDYRWDIRSGSGGKVGITGEIEGLRLEERLGLQVRYRVWEWRKGWDYRWDIRSGSGGTVGITGEI